MPLKLTANTKTGELKLAWSAEDESMEASWKIQAEDDEATVLDKLERVVRFVRQQRGDVGVPEIRPYLSNFLTKDADLAVDATFEKIQVPLPLQGANDLPAGGPPVTGWAALAGGASAGRPVIPPESAAEGWEYIPPEEM